MFKEKLVEMSEEGVAPDGARTSFTLAEGWPTFVGGRIRRRSSTGTPGSFRFQSRSTGSDATTCCQVGVRMAEDSTAILFVANHSWTNFNRIHREAALFLNVKRRIARGSWSTRIRP